MQKPTGKSPTIPHVLSVHPLSRDHLNHPHWYPNPILSVSSSDHPLDVCCRSDDLNKLRLMCNQDPSETFLSLHQRDLNNMTIQGLRDLLSPSTPVNQQALLMYLHQFSSQFNTAFLDTSFYSKLQQQGWGIVQCWFSSPTSRTRYNSRHPRLKGKPTISIPCHINGCHWVAVTIREINGRIYFLYADDTNSWSTEQTVQQVFSSSHPDFFP